MKPIAQTTFGVPGGNCFSACVASILELPIEEVPYFMEPTDWWTPFQAWLAERGFYCIHLGTGGDDARGYHILGGHNPRGPHSVVANGPEVVWDPNPNKDFIAGSVDCRFIIIPLDPAKARAA